LNRNNFDAMARKQVYKVTYPNGKIYVGMDLTGTISYFGSPSASAKERIATDLAEHRLDLTVRKETGANNPTVGYNLTPRWSEVP
jgi:hypothetical protein